MAERYITDSLDEYPIGACTKCGGAIGHADLTRREDWATWPGGDSDVPLLWLAEGTLTCTVCEATRKVEANVQSGSARPVFQSMTEVKTWTQTPA